MNHWNNFCKPSLEENFFPHFWVGTLSKRLHYARTFFQSFFYFSSSGRDFFPHLKVEILENFTVEKSFSRFVFFFFYWMSFYPHFWVCILSKRHHYARILFILSLLLLLGEVFLSFFGGHFFTRL